MIRMDPDKFRRATGGIKPPPEDFSAALSLEKKMTPEEREAWILVKLIKRDGYTILPSGLRTGEVRDSKKIEKIIAVLLKLHSIIEEVKALFAHKKIAEIEAIIAHEDKEGIKPSDNDEDRRIFRLVMDGEYAFAPDVKYPGESNEQEHKGETIEEATESAFEGIMTKYNIKENVDVDDTVPMEEIIAEVDKFKRMLLQHTMVVKEFGKYLEEKRNGKKETPATK